jgi:hypothetical protein
METLPRPRRAFQLEPLRAQESDEHLHVLPPYPTADVLLPPHVLLDIVRTNIQDTQKLNVDYYYESLPRATYKPAPFFKGILFPLLDVRAHSVLQFPRLMVI